MNHNEAYKLMRYTTETERHTVWVWNSRDGITPFNLILNPDTWEATVVTDPAGEMFRHKNIQEDAFVPNWIPPVGTLIFMDRPNFSENDYRAGEHNVRLVKVTPAMHENFKDLVRTSPMRIVKSSPVKH